MPDRGDERMVLALPGLEPDNLLALLALMGLLRSLETSRPEWNPRAFWKGPPWIPQLSITDVVEQQRVAHEANEGIKAIAANLDVDGRKNVDFDREAYRHYATRVRNQAICSSLATALSSESRPNKDRLPASPFVMMFGQGHQFFLDRLMAIVAGQEMSNVKLIEALFEPWRRDDDAAGFRWDPEDDQRYAFRYGNPSKAGAAPTVTGANRLAAIGFLSFATVPREQRLAATGAVYDGAWNFVWPIWTIPLSRGCIEALLNHPDVLRGRLSKVRPLGVAAIFQAHRVASGKYINVTRARPIEAESPLGP